MRTFRPGQRRGQQHARWQLHRYRLVAGSRSPPTTGRADPGGVGITFSHNRISSSADSRDSSSTAGPTRSPATRSTTTRRGSRSSRPANVISSNTISDNTGQGLELGTTCRDNHEQSHRRQRLRRDRWRRCDRQHGHGQHDHRQRRRRRQLHRGTGVKISENSIDNNTGLGINLVGGTEDSFGVTSNDGGDIRTASRTSRRCRLRPSRAVTSRSRDRSTALRRRPTRSSSSAATAAIRAATGRVRPSPARRPSPPTGAARRAST